MKSLELRRKVAQEISALRQEQAVIVVHGGGPVIEKNLSARQISSEFKRGLRVTTPEAMDVIEMAMARLSKELSQDLGQAVGLSGRDAQLMLGELMDPELGRVGQVTQVNTDLLKALLSVGYTPVIGCVAVDAEGEALNINADWAAGAVAGALGAPIIYLTDVDGVYRSYPDPSSLAPELSVAEVEQGIQAGWIAGGMIPKVEAARYALGRGAPSATIASGMQAGVLLQALSNNTGTRIVP